MPIPWIVSLLIGVALSIISYLIMPKPKQPKPEAAKDLESPTADAGRPMLKVFGSLTVKGLNIIYYGEKATITKTYKEG
jgi:hypothetical protein